MGKKWSVKTYTFEWWDFISDYHVYVETLDDYLLSAKLTMKLGDTSKLTFSLPYNTATEIKPIVTLVEARYGEGTSWDRKFFGTVTKKTKTAPDGVYKYEAVGVLGSYQFLPNYNNYNDDVSVADLIAIESNRFRGQYQSGTTYYTPSAWEKVYAGHNEIPSNFGLLNMNTSGMKFACNLESIQRNAKNSYEFLKGITKDGCYTLPSGSTWFRWFEEGEQAYFKPISGTNTQAIRYDTNLASCTIEETPYYTYVDAYTNSGGSYVRNVQSGNDYPNPFYSARIQIANKADDTTYSLSEVQNFVGNELADRKNIVEATGFDRHIVDNTVPWLDMSKYVNLVYYENYQEQTVQMQIAEITYDLCDSSKDRVKLGKIQQTLTDTMATNSALGDVVREYLPLTGGEMTGAITYDGGTSFDENKLEIRDRIFGTCNLIDMASLEQGGLNSSTGAEGNDTTRLRSGFTKVNPSTQYHFSVDTANKIKSLFYYNSSKVFISYVGLVPKDDGNFTTPSNCYYVRFELQNNAGTTILPSAISWLQLEKGSSASSYVPYAMDNVELTERCREWKDLGQWINTITLPSYATEFMVMPIINGAYRFPHKFFKVSNMIASSTQILFDTERGSNWYTVTFTYNPSTRVATLGTITKQTWSDVKFYGYAR